MAGGSSTKSNVKPRKRVEADQSGSASSSATLMRAKDGSAFARW